MMAWGRRKVIQALAAAFPATVFAGETRALAGSEDIAPLLQAQIKGVVIARGAPRYELWRQAMIWQHAKTSRQPDLIVQAESVEDVAAAINFARMHNIKVTTRCGGHSLAACFMREGGMLIDISRLDGVVVDGTTRIASAGPGVSGADLAQRLIQDGLAFPVAHSGMVPISGFLLGGGMGLNANGWSEGASALSIVGVDMVTADGVLRRVSAGEHPDLFWAIRGGGPGLFGVVTRFHLQCQPAPEMIFGAAYTFRLSDLVDVVRAMDEIAPKLDKNVEIMVLVTKGSPGLIKDCEEQACNQVAYLQANAFAPLKADGPRMLAGLSAHPIVSRAISGPDRREDTFESYFAFYDGSDSSAGRLVDNIFTDHPVAAAEILARHIPGSPSPQSVPILLYKGSPAMPDAACSTMGRFYLGYYFTWTEPHDEPANRRYALEVFRDLKPLSKGSYINEMNQEDRPQDVPSCYSPGAWNKLARLRTTWDPHGVFQPFYGQA